MIDIVQGVINGFSSGLGVGIANYFVLKRIEHIETKLMERKVEK